MSKAIDIRQLRQLSSRKLKVAVGVLACVAAASALTLWLTSGSSTAATLKAPTWTVAQLCPHWQPLPPAMLAKCKKEVASQDRWGRLFAEGRLPWQHGRIPYKHPLLPPPGPVYKPGQLEPAFANFTGVYSPPGYTGNDVGLLRQELARQYGINDLTASGFGSTATINFNFYAGGLQANGLGKGILVVNWGSRRIQVVHAVLRDGHLVTLPFHNKYPGSSGTTYITALPDGALTPTSVAGGIVTLKAVDGAIYTFNVNTLTFSRQSP